MEPLDDATYRAIHTWVVLGSETRQCVIRLETTLETMGTPTTERRQEFVALLDALSQRWYDVRPVPEAATATWELVRGAVPTLVVWGLTLWVSPLAAFSIVTGVVAGTTLAYWRHSDAPPWETLQQRHEREREHYIAALVVLTLQLKSDRDGMLWARDVIALCKATCAPIN